MANAIWVLLADDHPLVLDGARLALTSGDNVEVVGRATKGEEVQQLNGELRPDVLLLEPSMLGLSAVEEVASMRAHQPEVRIVTLTDMDDGALVRILVGLGIAGYVLKTEPPSAVVRAVQVAAEGGTYLSEGIAAKLAARESPPRSGDPILTGRERQLLSLLATGYKTERIAHTLILGTQTTRNYLSRLYAKLGVSNRAEAMAWAREKGVA